MPKLTIDGKEVEVARGHQPHRGGAAGRRRGAALLLSPRAQHRRASAGSAWWTSRRSPRPQIACNTQAADGMVVHTQTERVLETRRSVMEFHLDQPPARLPGVRPGGRVLAADLLHAARPLRSADGRREGPQAQGGAARAARHPGRGALHPLLALRALLRRGHAAPASSASSTGATTRRSGSSRARRSRTSTRATSSTSARWARSPTATSASRCASGTSTRAKSVCNGCARGLQHRGPHEPPAPAPQPGPAGRAAQAALQRRRQPVVDLRRGPLRLRLDRRRQPGSRRRPPRGAGRAVATQLGRGRRRARRPRSGATGPRRSGSSPRPRCRTRTCSRCSGSPTSSALAHVDHRVPPARCRATRTTS